VRVKGGAKLDILHDLLNQKEFNKVLVFGRTKHGVERLAKTLIERGFKAESIHGNKNHSQRQRALNAFKENKVQVLVATDVAARGLDIADVSHVINYDLPQPTTTMYTASAAQAAPVRKERPLRSSNNIWNTSPKYTTTVVSKTFQKNGKWIERPTKSAIVCVPAAINISKLARTRSSASPA
jgi:reverse gyrase